MLPVLAALVLTGGFAADKNDSQVCVDKPNGYIPMYGCRSYSICRGGEMIIDECPSGLVFDIDIEACNYRENTSAPCGLLVSCEGKADGFYPDFECKAYYQCDNEDYRGHNPCPGGLVFNDDLDVCDWDWNTPPPCGTKIPDIPEPEAPTEAPDYEDVTAEIIDTFDLDKNDSQVCVDKPNGYIPMYGCRSYSVCRGGEMIIEECPSGLVFDIEIEACNYRENTSAPCGLLVSCEGKADGFYPDFECKAYYQCDKEDYRGHNPCPGGLVFNDDLDVCDWDWNVPPPCGTKIPDIPKPEAPTEAPDYDDVTAEIIDAYDLDKNDSHVCVDKPNGYIPMYGCRSYSICRGGEMIIEECPSGLVFDIEIEACNYRENTSAPCGLLVSCEGKANGFYPDFECKAYYQCDKEDYRGHNPCPGGLVFNDDLDVCDWDWNTPPPCGTKIPDIPEPEAPTEAPESDED